MLCLLGPPAAQLGDETRPLKLRPKALALLARLAIQGPEARSLLAELIFPEAEDARASLRWHLTFLRAQLPESIKQDLVVTLEDAAFEGPTDVQAFQHEARRLVEQPGDPRARSVLALYRGDLCAGLTVSASAVFDTWLYVQQEALRRAFRQATVAVAQYALANANAVGLDEPLAKLIAVDPYFEDGHRLLIDVHEALGRRDAAEAAYQRYQRIVRQELQTEPPHSIAQRYEPGVATKRTPPTDSLVSLRQLTLHVVDWPGAEPAIVAVHGSTMSAYAFTALAERLAPDVRFVAMDLRGHGFSDKPPSGYSMDQHVEDVRELIALLGLHNPVVLGFSMGGAIATFLATRTRCAGLILLDGVVGDRAFRENAAALVVPSQRATHELRVGGFDEYLTNWRATISVEGFSDDGERVLERTIRYELAQLPDGTYRRRTLTAAFEETWASLLQSDNLAALARVRCPTLIVQATRPWIGGRPYLADDIIASQRDAARQAQLFVAHHCTHPMLARDPEPGLVQAILRFVDSLRRSSPR